MTRFNLSALILPVTIGLVLSSCAQVKTTGSDTGMDFAENDDDSDGGFDWGDESDDDGDDDRDDPGDSNMAPSVVITAPADGDVFKSGDEITFLATVSDDQDDVSMLQIEWNSDVVGMLNDDPSDGTSEIVFVAEDLETGRHIISLEATDTEGATSSSTVMITVEEDDDDNTDDDDSSDDDTTHDPDDSDGDGFTIEEGDCDDDNWWAYPGAEEYCDGIDNDCDGWSDEDFWDDYESNDVLGLAIDLGELDYDGFTGELYSIELVDLTLHADNDEDWFRFDADDDLYDDIDLTVTYQGAEDAMVTMELYQLDWDSTIPWDEITGSGELILTETGSGWDSGEDNWAIRIIPHDESGADCSSPYSLQIQV